MAITDSFTGSDGASLGAGWAAAEGTAWQIASNKAVPIDGYAVSAMVRTESSFPANQYAQALCASYYRGCFSSTSPAICISGNSYYWLTIGTASLTIYRRDSGSDTYFADGAITSTLGVMQTYKLEITGTSIKAYQDGVQKVSVTDATPLTGKPGMYGYKSNTVPTADDFECTDATATSVAVTGTATSSITEADIVAGGKTVIATVTVWRT